MLFKIPFQKKIFFFLVVSIFAACNHEKEKKEKNQYLNFCSFSELKNIEIKEIKSNENKNDFKIGLGIHIDKFFIDLKGLDYNYLSEDVNSTEIVENITYSSERLSQHNQLCQILCSLEKDLRDTLVESERRGELRQSYDELRINYANFLLNKTELSNEKPKIKKERL